MPQVDRRVVKERAARLREAGAAALTRHLDAWVGQEAVGIVERDDFARLPDFTGVVIEGREASPPPLRGRFGRGRTQEEAQTAPARVDLLAPHPQPPPRKAAGAKSLRLRFTAHDGAHLIGVAA
jgi:hypothetical protein